MLCLDREIKKHFKCMHFFEVFQLAWTNLTTKTS